MKLKDHGADMRSLRVNVESWKQNKAVLLVLGLLVYSLVVFAAGILSSEEKLVSSATFIENTRRFPELVSNRISGALSTPDQLKIDIKHKHFQKLAYKRQVARIMNMLVSSNDDFVPASMSLNGEQVDVKLRLKGDGIDHLDGDKWSYRVKVKDDDALLGMRTFSIQHPKTRNYLAEWVYHEMLKRENVLALRYDFLNVTVNGKDLGIFAIEEHFDKILIEHNRRREGPIIRPSEDLVWEMSEELLAFPQSFPASSASFNAVLIDAFDTSAILADSAASNLFLKAISLLESFRDGKKLAREVFDIPKLASYIAVSELLGAHHSINWNHMRFYFNPVTSKLEPIGFDGNAGLPLPLITGTMNPKELFGWRRHYFTEALKDPLFVEAYLSALNRVSQPEFLNKFYKDIDPEFQEKLKVLYKEFPAYQFPFDVIERNRAYIFFTLNPSEAARAHLLKKDRNSVTLELGSTQILPVEATSLIISDTLEIPFTSNVVLSGREKNKGIHFVSNSVALPEHIAITDSTILAVKYNIIGTNKDLITTVLPYPHEKEDYLTSVLNNFESNLAAFPFLSLDEEHNQVNIKPGNWTVRKNMVLPPKASLQIMEGTTLDLQNNALILATGPISITGNPDNQVKIFSSDSTGQGLVVLQAASKSYLSHTTFKDLRSVNQHGWNLTGGVTFYESEVQIEHVIFDGAKSEDALNIISTSFEMDSVLFRNTYSDAFDGDFVEGTITNTIFEDPGNDGIDVSGSKLSIQNVSISNAGDKAFSAGELSITRGENLTILNSAIALASKDQSVVELNDVRILNSRLGAAIFQKKPEFGPASLEINGLKMEDVEVPALVEKGSYFWMNDTEIPADKEQVSEMLYGNIYGTASH